MPWYRHTRETSTQICCSRSYLSGLEEHYNLQNSKHSWFRLFCGFKISFNDRFQTYSSCLVRYVGGFFLKDPKHLPELQDMIKPPRLRLLKNSKDFKAGFRSRTKEGNFPASKGGVDWFLMVFDGFCMFFAWKF